MSMGERDEAPKAVDRGHVSPENPGTAASSASAGGGNRAAQLYAGLPAPSQDAGAPPPSGDVGADRDEEYAALLKDDIFHLGASEAGASAPGSSATKAPAENAHMVVRAYTRKGGKLAGEWKGNTFWVSGAPAASYRVTRRGSKWSWSSKPGRIPKVNSDATGTTGQTVTQWAASLGSKVTYLTVTVRPLSTKKESLSGKKQIIMDPTLITLNEIKKKIGKDDPNTGTGEGDKHEDGTADGTGDKNTKGGRKGDEDGTGGQGTKGSGTGGGGGDEKNKPGTSKKGNSQGTTDGSSKPSWSNADSEIAKIGGRTPADGGKKGGGADGEKGGTGKYITSFWKDIIQIPELIGPMVALGVLITEADVLGVTDRLFKHALKKTVVQVRKVLQGEVQRRVARQMERVTAALNKSPVYRSLPKRERQRILKRTKLAIERQFYNEVSQKAAKRAADYEKIAAKLKANRNKSDLARHAWENARDNAKAYRKLEKAASGKSKSAERKFQKAKQAAKAAKNVKGKGGLTWKSKAVVEFDGFEVRGVRNLKHMDEGDLRDMAKHGTAAVDHKGRQLQIHHLNQNPKGPFVEIPRKQHSIHNRKQHPYGNAPGHGLTDQERSAFDAWRERYWKARARDELSKRGVSL